MEHRDAKGPSAPKGKLTPARATDWTVNDALSVGRERLDTLAPNRVLRAIPPAVVALDLAIVTRL